jgi:hypothetical protein
MRLRRLTSPIIVIFFLKLNGFVFDDTPQQILILFVWPASEHHIVTAFALPTLLRSLLVDQ